MAEEVDNEKLHLDLRMEEIRLKNEELEKKHKEILEDEMNAKRENAVVNLKSSSTDIPKDHPYDKLELDFDVKDAEKELAKNPETAKPKNRRPMPRKEFLDEIPPDPVNFLREDGDESQPKSEPNQRPQNNKNNRNNRNRPERQRSNNESGGDGPKSGDSPPLPKTQNQRPRPNPQQQNRSPQDGNSSPKKPPQQLRNERRSVPNQGDDQQSQQQPNRQRRPNNRPPPNKEGGDVKNITVQVSDGEVRSVKLKSERTFGTGRVGHARPANGNAQKFTVDTFNPEGSEDRSGQDRSGQDRSGQNRSGQDRSPQDMQRNRNPRNNQNRRNQKPKEFKHPTLDNMIIPKASVQDRLLKIAKDNEAATGDVGDANTGN